MFGLGEPRRSSRRGRVVRKTRIRWSRQQIDADNSKDLTFRLDNEGISRTENFCTGRIVDVPKASAAIACAPPTR